MDAPRSFSRRPFWTDVQGSRSAIAAAHFDSPGGSAVLARQRVPVSVSRLFMTFIETPQMSERYREAEAVLIGAPGNPLF
jgi:hypothetical protein